jgi:hypothetical protein
MNFNSLMNEITQSVKSLSTGWAIMFLFLASVMVLPLRRNVQIDSQAYLMGPESNLLADKVVEA